MSFFASSSRRNGNDARDQSPLLNEHRGSVSLRTLSPRGTDGTSRASPSPPPSFYRDLNSNIDAASDYNGLGNYKDSEIGGFRGGHFDGPSREESVGSGGGSPSKTRSKKRIQFSAPPPPIVSSVLLSPEATSAGTRFGASYPEQSGRSTSRGSKSPAGPSSVGARGISLDTRSPRGIVGMDPLLVLERRERALQAELQNLLDAQSAGLVQGFGGSSAQTDASSDAGSSTPTTRSIDGRERSRDKREGRGGVVPVRQPKKKPLSLRGARKGLLRDMGSLVEVKNEEGAILEGEIARREKVLTRVAEWEMRIEGVRKQLSSYTGSGSEEESSAGTEEDSELAELKTEERAVDNEIREMEDRLAQMQARKRWLGERIKEGVNRREARLSSYRGALKEVEVEVKSFLARPPIQASVVMGGEDGFTSLPSNRRTLGLAKEWWNKEVSTLQTRREEVETEKQALEDGARIWAESINIVVEFEDELRRQMTSGGGDPAMLREQIEKMGAVIKELEGTRALVESKGWNLLICAVGAELEAFKEGEAILRGALRMISPPSPISDPFETPEERERTHNQQSLHEQAGSLLDEDASMKEDGHETDNDNDSALLHELNTGVGSSVDGGEHEIEINGQKGGVATQILHGRASFGSEVSDDGPDLAELMVDRVH